MLSQRLVKHISRNLDYSNIYAKTYFRKFRENDGLHFKFFQKYLIKTRFHKGYLNSYQDV